MQENHKRVCTNFLAQSWWSNTWPCVITQQLRLPNNSGLLQSLVACKVANLAFLTPNFEFLDFLTHLAFFENQEYQSKSGFIFYNFFSLKGLASGKTLSELHIHYKSSLMWVYDHSGCKEYCKRFYCCPKTFQCR